MCAHNMGMNGWDLDVKGDSTKKTDINKNPEHKMTKINKKPNMFLAALARVHCGTSLQTWAVTIKTGSLHCMSMNNECLQHLVIDLTYEL